MPGEAYPLEVPLDYRALLHAVPGPWVVLLPDAPRFTIAAASDSYFAAAMQTPADLLGRGLFESLPDANPENPHPTGQANIRASLERVLRTKAPDRLSEQRYDAQRPDGTWEEYYWEPLNTPVLGDNGEVRCILQTMENVTARIRAQRAASTAEGQLSMAMADAERANRAKSDFLAVMSHELRTPLNAISGYADLLELGVHGPLNDGQRNAITRIQFSQQHLLGLINDVLNYARLETGSVHYDLADVSVVEVLDGVEALVAPQVRRAGLQLSRGSIPPDLAIRADAEKVRQILLNLLSNAVKFTDAASGPGHIDLSAASEGGTVHIRVRDTGIGIAPEKLESIFEPFVQVRGDLTRTAEGTGLGLAISRDLARGMGGDLRAESTRGRGSIFTLTLPRAD